MKILAPHSAAYISSILGSGTSEIFPLVLESTLLTLWLKIIYFSEINTHSPPGGFTRCGFLGDNNNWTGPWTEALFDDACSLQGLDLLLYPAVMF